MNNTHHPTQEGLCLSSATCLFTCLLAQAYYCSGPITLENGWLAPRQTRYRVGDVVQFHCQPGYLLFGPRNITCLSTGKWSAPPAVCEFGGKETITQDQ